MLLCHYCLTELILLYIYLCFIDGGNITIVKLVKPEKKNNNKVFGEETRRMPSCKRSYTITYPPT